MTGMAWQTVADGDEDADATLVSACYLTVCGRAGVWWLRHERAQSSCRPSPPTPRPNTWNSCSSPCV